MSASLRRRWVSILILWVLSVGAIGAHSAFAAESAPPAVTVRLFLDLQDPLCREAWRVYRRSLAPLGSGAALIVHHLPLARHSQARPAALAALWAASKRREATFIDALLAWPLPDLGALEGAAKRAGLDVEELRAVLASGSKSPWSEALERGRQAAVAFGVRVAPSALINGRGVAGVPPVLALTKAIARARQRCEALRRRRLSADCELLGLRRHARGSEGAFRALRTGAGVSKKAPRSAPDHLGDRYRVELLGDELSAGGTGQPVTAVYFADLLDPRQRSDLRHLLALQAPGGLRVVFVPLPRFQPSGRGPARGDSLRLALSLITLQPRISKAGRASLLAELADRRFTGLGALKALASRQGVTATLLSEAVAAPATTVRLEASLKLATQVDARPGTVYLNGRRWQGAVGPALKGALLQLRREAARLVERGVPARRLYSALVSQGRVITQAERDLQAVEELGDTSAMPLLCGISAPDGRPPLPVHLFVDFRSLASRAAFHGLRRLCQHGRYPIALRMVSIASAAKPGVTPAGNSFVVAAAKGKGLEAARRLFSMRDPNAWSALRRVMRRLGVTLKQLRARVDGPGPTAAAETAMRLKRVLEMDEDPIIYIAGRRYIGPLDEQRLESAVVFAGRRRGRGTEGKP